eukprot:g9314.t1 g9314   contig36:318691-319152(+)
MSCQQSRLVDDAKRVQSLAAKISEIGTTLQGLLKNEAEDSIERRRAIDFLNSATLSGTSNSEKQHIEATLTRLLASTNDEVEQLDQQCKMLLSSVKGMREKIRKKTIDLERNVARLESLEVSDLRSWTSTNSSKRSCKSSTNDTWYVSETWTT